jgi:hypothetical protein
LSTVKEANLHRHGIGAATLLRFLVLSAAARLLLRSASVCIRFMQCLYNHRLIGLRATDRSHQPARWLDRWARFLASEQISTPLAHDRS